MPLITGVAHRSARNRSPFALALALALLSVPHAAQALVDCAVTAVNLNFGAYDPLVTAPDDSAGTVAVTCRYLSGGASRTNYTVTISNGLNSISTSTRRMSSGSARLNYNVFTDATYAKIWGTGAGGTVIVNGAMTVGPGSGNGDTVTVTHTVYGRIPQLQDAVPGSYTDSLLVTLTF